MLTFIGGGHTNVVSAKYGTIGGGNTNTIDSQYSIIGGGGSNSIHSEFGVIGGGETNTLGRHAFSYLEVPTLSVLNAILGGASNTIDSSAQSVIGGGYDNVVMYFSSAVVGGIQNTLKANESFIGGGASNHIDFTTRYSSADFGVIGGGYGNGLIADLSSWLPPATASYNAPYDATIAGGDLNIVAGNFGAIGGGQNDSAEGLYSNIPGVGSLRSITRLW